MLEMELLFADAACSPSLVALLEAGVITQVTKQLEVNLVFLPFCMPADPCLLLIQKCNMMITKIRHGL